LPASAASLPIPKLRWPNRHLIETERRPSLAAAVDAALVDRGIAVSELVEIPPDVERVFLDLTRRPAKEASEKASKEAA
jgi:hypothetical protein